MGERYKIKYQNILSFNMSEINVSRLYIFAIPISVIMIGELLISYRQIYFGLGIHMVNLLAIMLMIITSSMKIEMKNILQCLTLTILIRIINLSVPEFFTTAIAQYSMIYGIMYIPVYLTIKNQNVSLKDLGISMEKFYIYLPMSIIIGIMVALIGYNILHLETNGLIDGISPKGLILMSTVLFMFISPIEEMIFRSLLQTRLEKMFNYPGHILLSASLFAVMHYNGMETFALFFGIINGYIFYKTKSLPFVIMTNGIVNIMLFGILPNIAYGYILF